MEIRTVSIIVPVYNEERLITETVRRVHAADLGFPGLSKQIIVVDDGSTDGTGEELKRCSDIETVSVAYNRGKGHAIKTGLSRVHGEIVIIQDADLEYDPAEYPVLLKPILDGHADVVYGSRFVGDRPHRALFFWHFAANRSLTLLANIASNLNLTDMETGHKAFRTDALRSIRLTEPRFGFEPEVTIKLARKGYRFYEVGVSYDGRTYEEGKKITWKDGLSALRVIIHTAFIAEQ